MGSDWKRKFLRWVWMREPKKKEPRKQAPPPVPPQRPYDFQHALGVRSIDPSPSLAARAGKDPQGLLRATAYDKGLSYAVEVRSSDRRIFYEEAEKSPLQDPMASFASLTDKAAAAWQADLMARTNHLWLQPHA